MFASVKSGESDLAIGGISITARREETYDFSLTHIVIKNQKRRIDMFYAFLAALIFSIGGAIVFFCFRTVEVFVNNTRVGGWLFSFWLVFTVANVAMMPTWFYVLALAGLQPVGFWQTFALTVLGLYCLCGLQIVLLIILVIFVCAWFMR